MQMTSAQIMGLVPMLVKQGHTRDTLRAYFGTENERQLNMALLQLLCDGVILRRPNNGLEVASGSDS